jgi:hypothetical protein
MTDEAPRPERRRRNLGPRARREPGPVEQQRLDDGPRSLVTDRNLPLWARMMALVGIPGTIAFFLVYVGAQTLPALQTQLAVARAAVESELVALKMENQRLSQLLQLNQTRTEENHRLLVRICAAVTEGKAQAACFDR